ncbi:MAG TPA: universal stress protein [Chloroflexia bacterium]|nr:universal stress protein [Chloroflexia bacterium]
MYTHILVALDGSETAEQVLPHVEALVEKFGAAVTLLRVTTPPSLTVTPAIGLPMAAPADLYTAEQMTEALEEEQRDAAAYLRSVGDRLRARGERVDEVVAEGHPAQVILERAEAVGADLIAMTTHGRSGLQRLFLGSVAEEVVRRASCAVLLVRARHDGAPA